MILLKNIIPGSENIRNIIFDFGGVLCDLDIQRTVEKFKEFGPAKSDGLLSREEQDNQFALLVETYEKGNIISREFRDAIKNHYLIPPTDQAVDDTWNALLVGIPVNRIELLRKIKDHYRIFLLSNSNEIHYLHYLDMFRHVSGYKDFNDLFEKAYFSFQLHLAKPGREIFEFVLRDSQLNPLQTLFIDDTLKHIETARKLSINGYHLQLQKGEMVIDLFE